ncbi:MAG: glycoside hydrolase family 127 protein [Acidimicrobiales bacterium]|nr:glycoside hydrolase family 127 protein [Acidimicrobiales bacterium]
MRGRRDRLPAVELQDAFWAPRRTQLRDHTLPVLLERFESHGILDTFRRLAPGAPDTPRQGLWFSDSDVYKWMEAAAWAERLDLLEPIIELVHLAARPDGYLHTYYDVGPGSQPRYRDLGSSHELYCGGHFTEAALAHHAVTGSDDLLDLARRWADHVCATFGPGRDERVDAHPEVELALARLAERTGQERYLAQARWMVEHLLGASGATIDTVELSGHAVRALYLASGIAEIARVGGDSRWRAAAERLFDSLVREHTYPTGAVGGRWMEESVGKPFELPDAMAYAESCAAVAAAQFSRRIWDLVGDPRALDQLELGLFNAVPCGVGADGESWFYSQPQAVSEVACETNPWVQPFDYGPNMVLQWFPARRHPWFEVLCCPPNLARLFATVHDQLAELDDAGNLLVHLPLAAHVTGGGWDVTVEGGYPDDGTVTVHVDAAPADGEVRVRVAGWADGHGHVPVDAGAVLELPVQDQWWESDHRIEGVAGTVFLRRGPVVCCVEGVDVPGVDLRDLVVDPTRPPSQAFARRVDTGRDGLHHPVAEPAVEPVAGVRVVPYHAWANRGPTTMRVRFPRR